jgi:hypothetical protein
MAPKDSKKQQQQQHSVVVSPSAFTTMFLHASSHSTTVVHGALLGKLDKNVLTVTEAIPVCHEHPTKPLVEMALALIQAQHSNKTVVGWYTAPERLDDDRPGPAALRIVASLAAAAASSGEPVLLVLRNGPLVKTVLQETLDEDASKSNNMILAFGKDFGQQWLQPVPIQIDQPAKACKTARDSFQNGNVVVVDLVDHWESPTAVDWST